MCSSDLSLSRQNLATLERPVTENLSARGAYVLREPAGGRDVTLLATGSEVELILTAADQLAAKGIKAAVVSMPCWELFEAQTPDYRASVLGKAPRIGVEAAVRLGWDRWLGERSAFIGMNGFGASGPADALYKLFDITPEAVVREARRLLVGATDRLEPSQRRGSQLDRRVQRQRRELLPLSLLDALRLRLRELAQAPEQVVGVAAEWEEASALHGRRVAERLPAQPSSGRR